MVLQYVMSRSASGSSMAVWRSHESACRRVTTMWQTWLREHGMTAAAARKAGVAECLLSTGWAPSTMRNVGLAYVPPPADNATIGTVDDPDRASRPAPTSSGGPAGDRPCVPGPRRSSFHAGGADPVRGAGRAQIPRVRRSGLEGVR